MAYAAVSLLMQSLEDQSLEPYYIDLKKEEIAYLHEEFGFLLKFFNDMQEIRYGHDVFTDLEIRIRDLAYKVVDIIDSQVYMSSINSAKLELRTIKWNLPICSVALQGYGWVVEEIESIKLEVEKIYEEQIDEIEDVPAKIPLNQNWSTTHENGEDKLVGVDTDIETLLDRLTGQPRRLQVIPIVGMGGIGKTALASRIYNDPLVVYHFHVKAWATVSQGHNLSLAYKTREILLGIIECFTSITDETCRKTNEQLGEQLYKTLKGRRYLIVLDDLWLTRIWDALEKFLPDDQTGSRIMLTSRSSDVSLRASSKGFLHCMHFLDEAESWELLESKLFGGERCPPEMVETGKRIAVKCQGLPLTIVVIAGLLNKMSKTLDCWKRIAESVDSLVSEEPERCIDILALSYNYLPNSLKACFLYMGAFPEDKEIPVTKLIWLWIAEGFIRPAQGKCLEEVAEMYLQDLVNRNLILVQKRRSNGRIRTCRIHDLLRDFCLREAQKARFLNLVKPNAPFPLRPASTPRRICVHTSLSHYFYVRHSIPTTRSFLCFNMSNVSPNVLTLEFLVQQDFPLLRVLDMILLHFNHFPIEIVDLIHLRFLALAINCDLPGSISKLQNLEILMIDHSLGGIYLPREIWMMSKLRHIHIKGGCYLPLPCSTVFGKQLPLLLENLQTLSTVIGPVSCFWKAFACIPHLKKLNIFATETGSDVEWTSNCLSNLSNLNKLEKLKCSFLYGVRNHRLPRWDVFPTSLKRLTLTGGNLPWEDIGKLMMLPNLEVLKLRHHAFDGDSWKTVDGEFPQLKLLVMEKLDLWSWDADISQFPRLQRLVLRECKRLVALPESIGDIPTMQLIEVHNCSHVLVCSAERIQQEQEMMGNDELRIRTTYG